MPFKDITTDLGTVHFSTPTRVAPRFPVQYSGEIINISSDEEEDMFVLLSSYDAQSSC